MAPEPALRLRRAPTNPPSSQTQSNPVKPKKFCCCPGARTFLSNATSNSEVTSHSSSPHPCPLPKGEGTAKCVFTGCRQCALSAADHNLQMNEGKLLHSGRLRFPLSPRERVGVRGISNSDMLKKLRCARGQPTRGPFDLSSISIRRKLRPHELRIFSD